LKAAGRTCGYWPMHRHARSGPTGTARATV